MVRKPDLKAIERSLRDKTEPRPPTPWEKFVYRTNRDRLTAHVILDHVRGKPQVIYGSRAMNRQIPRHLARTPKDWDILTHRALREADIIEDKLDAIFGSDMFFVKPIVIWDEKGYPGVVYRVISRADKKPIIDYVSKQKFPPYVEIEDVKYETLKSLRRRYRALLKDSRYKFRWVKTRADLVRADKAIEQMEWSRQMKNMVFGLLR